MVIRASVVVALLLAAGLYGTRAQSAEADVARESLATLPLEIGGWRGQEALQPPCRLLMSTRLGP